MKEATKTKKSALLRLVEFASRRGRNFESRDRPGAGEQGEARWHGQLQRETEGASQTSGVPPIVERVLDSPGESLDARTRNYFEPRFGHDFSRVRVHADSQAAESAVAVGARAYTAGEDVVFSPGRYRPDASDGRRLLAHELAHVVQQENSSPQMVANEVSISQPEDPAEVAADNAANLIMSQPGQRVDPAALRGTTAPIQRTVDDPKRFQEVHTAIFPVGKQAPGGGTLLDWEDADAAKSIVGTAETLFKQAQANFKQYFQKNPGAAGGTMKVQTTEADLDKDAVDVNQELRKRFPFISIPVSEPQVKAAVNVMTPKLTSDPDYLRKWLANRLEKFSDVEKYKIDEADPRFIALLDRLLADSDVGADLKVQASRQGGFQRGEGTKREIFIHSAADPKKRQKMLFHELVHFYAHPTYREWVATTTNERWYNEGFTEFLARLAMPPDLLSMATDYQDRVNDIKTQVAAHVPEDDIARAYFKGEIWRIETRSQVSRREAGGQLGLKETATEKEEIEASRAGPGINQTVEKGKRYRFMNLGFDRVTPKPEHVAFFHEIKTEELDPAPSVGVRFEGHASTAGTLAYNLSLSLGRALAFYQMARKEGITGDRLIDAAKPPHFGETKPTAEEEDPLTRAFNRRVEMELRPTSKKKP